MEAFLRFPEDLYRGDPRWVPPLRRDERARLAPAHPFFAHAEARLFLARRDGAVVGRVAAIVNRLHLARWGDGAGFFGFFEAVADQAVAEALMGQVTAWLRTRDLSAVRGPVNPSTHDECGLLTDGFDRPPCLLMPYNPAYYPALLEGMGFRPIRDLVSYAVEVPRTLPDRVELVARAAEGRGIRARSLDSRRLPAEVEVIRGIYNAAWGDNWGVVPLTAGEAASLASRLRAVLVPDLALIAERNGRPVGFMLILPDYNPAIRLLRGRVTPWGLARFLWRSRRLEAGRLLALGVIPEARRQGVDALLYREALAAVRRRGYHRVEAGWILEENAVTRRAVERWGGRVVKRYRLYERPVRRGGL
jgi:GNAT superfamily N-acetyltransferase